MKDEKRKRRWDGFGLVFISYFIIHTSCFLRRFGGRGRFLRGDGGGAVLLAVMSQIGELGLEVVFPGGKVGAVEAAGSEFFELGGGLGEHVFLGTVGIGLKGGVGGGLGGDVDRRG